MITEDQLEQLAIQWFQDTGWSYANGTVISSEGEAPERKDFRSVVLKGKGEMTLKAEQALEKLLEKVDVLRGLFHGFDYSAFRTKGLLLLPDGTNHILGLEKDGERNGKKRFLDAMAAANVAFSLCSLLDGARALHKELAFFDS